MFRKIIRGFAFIALFAGIVIFFYPQIEQWISEQKEQKRIEQYEEEISNLKDSDTDKKEELLLDYLYSEMQIYNEKIYKEGQRNLKDPFSYEEASFDLTEWGIEDNMFGYLLIPKMDQELPVYLGASKENMKKGAVHMSQTSLPIGGENTNAVIAAHRGMSSAAMFREIEKLEPGDPVTIRNPWGELTYRVSYCEVLEPEEIKKVLIQDGKDMLTLLTCHPYPVNNKRYAVYCERTEKEQEPTQETPDTDKEDQGDKDYTMSAVDIEFWVRTACGLILVTAALVVLIRTVRRKSRRKKR